MSMPETAMHKHYSIVCWKDKIGCAGQIAPVQAKA